MSPRPVLTIRSPCEAWCKRNYRGRSPDSQVVAIRPTFPLPKEQWLLLAGSLAAHSGATARDSHPLPFSLAAHGEHLGIAPIEPYLGVRRQIDRLGRVRETRARRSLSGSFGIGPGANVETRTAMASYTFVSLSFWKVGRSLLSSAIPRTVRGRGSPASLRAMTNETFSPETLPSAIGHGMPP